METELTVALLGLTGAMWTRLESRITRLESMVLNNGNSPTTEKPPVASWYRRKKPGLRR